MTEETPEVQRGKRKTARYAEITLVALLVATLLGYPNALEALQIALLPVLAYAAALRGLDAHYK